MDTDMDPTLAGAAPAAAPAAPEPTPAGPGGTTRIADGIVAKTAAWAARGVDGVEDLRGGVPRRGWVRSSDRRGGGASVRVEGAEASISLRLVVREGVAIPRVVDEVRARVIDRVEFSTGLRVSAVDVHVVDVVPAPAPADGPAPAAADPVRPSGADGEDPPSPS